LLDYEIKPRNVILKKSFDVEVESYFRIQLIVSPVPMAARSKA